MRTECSVYVICNNHQVRIVFFHDIYNPCGSLGTQCITGRVTGIGNEECLDLRVSQAVYIFVFVLPGVQSVCRHLIRRYFRNVKFIASQLRNFNIRSEDRYHQGDSIPFIEQEVFLQRVENVAHGCCSAFGGKQIVFAFRRTTVAHLLCQIVLHNHFGKLQNAVRHRILIAYHSFRPFVDKGIRVGSMFQQHVLISPFQQLCPRLAVVGLEESLKAGGNSVFLRNTGYSFRQVHHTPTLFQSEFT